MRIRDWRIPLSFLILCGLIEKWVFADPGTATPIMTHQNDPAVQREFINTYASINQRPAIVSGSGVPKMGPEKAGNIYIDTQAGKIYISTGSSNAGNWVRLN
jgi:hypothetical protein